MAHVLSVLGPVDAATLGVTNAHEHLFLRSPAMPGQEMDDVDRAIEEVTAAQASGLQALVELTPIGLGRRPDLLRAVAQETGMVVIGATGFHRDEHYPPGHWAREADIELLRDRMLADIQQGMHANDWDDPSLPLDEARAGVIKTGGSYHHLTDAERRRLQAAGAASKATGVTVVVHAEIGTAGHEIADVLESAGAAPQRIVLAHMDRNPDAELHIDLLARGLGLVYDTPGRTKYNPDSVLLKLVEDVVGAGYGEQLMLGLDLGRSEYFRAYGGGPGMRYLMDAFVPRLERRIGTGMVRSMLVDNPARIYAVGDAA